MNSTQSTPNHAPSGVLHAELDSALGFPPEYANGLSSHLPMALQALHEMGASAAQMRAFALGYCTRFAKLAKLPKAQAQQSSNWQRHIGQFDAFKTLQSHFLCQVRRHGSHATVQDALPKLWPGLAGAAFHGLIRLAHALRSDHAAETATALAYWASRSLPLAGCQGAAPRLFHSATEWLTHLEQHIEQNKPSFAGQTIMRRMVHAQASSTYQTFANALVLDSETAPTAFAQFNAWAAQLYADTGNFTVLHVVTGSRAALQLLPLMQIEGTDGKAPWLQACQAMCAALLAAQFGPRQAISANHLSWPEVLARVCQHEDDHAIKLVHSAWLGTKTQELLSERSAYSAAAQRALRGD